MIGTRSRIVDTVAPDLERSLTFESRSEWGKDMK